MAAGPTTQVADLIIPENFSRYVQQTTTQKARIVQSGVLAPNALLDQFLAGGGLTFNIPSNRDLDDDADNVSTDGAPDVLAATAGGTWPSPRLDATPFKVGTDQEVAVRMSRNGHWGTSDLAGDLAGDDPVGSIQDRVSYWWARKMQKTFIATWQGVSKDNAVNDGGDYAHDIATPPFAEGVTNFSASAFIEAEATMGDSEDELGIMLVHSVVKATMKKNNLIDFIPDARGETRFQTFQGYRIVVDNGMPSGTNVVRDSGAAGVAGMYETWLFGPGAAQLGTGSPKVPTEVTRFALGGNGGGHEVLTSRMEWMIHPVGHAFVGSAPSGGPLNGIGANNLNNAGSWDRRRPERQQVKFARLITREA